MDLAPTSVMEGGSPRSFAISHQRPKLSFRGCSRIGDYELQGKLGEGTFGYEPLKLQFPPNLGVRAPPLTRNLARFIEHDRKRLARSSP